jgi:site-specific DNA recombinase
LLKILKGHTPRVTTTKPQAAALYIRISRDKAGKALGIERQEDECRAWAKANGWGIADTYADNDKTASKSNVRRSDYERMIADVRSGKRDGILCWDTDRLIRQLRDLADLIDLTQETGAPLGTISGVIDLTTTQGRFVTTILGGVARQEVEHKSDRIKAQRRQKAMKGQPTTRRRPFGWTDNTCLSLHPVDGPALQKAAADLLAGKTVRGITVQGPHREQRARRTTPSVPQADPV